MIGAVAGRLGRGQAAVLLCALPAGVHQPDGGLLLGRVGVATHGVELAICMPGIICMSGLGMVMSPAGVPVASLIAAAARLALACPACDPAALLPAALFPVALVPVVLAPAGIVAAPGAAVARATPSSAAVIPR